MRFLLDTHVVLWATFDSDKLSNEVKETISNTDNQIIVSSISFWELSIKFGLGKIQLSTPPDLLPEMVSKIGFDIISASISELASVFQLPTVNNHKDPFDRLLIWQALKNNWTMVSKDPAFSEYKPFGLQLFW